MPSDTFIEYNNKGFWIYEQFVEILSQFICKTLENIGINNLSQSSTFLYEICNGNRLGSFEGITDIPLDECILTSEDKLNVINLLDQTKSLILTYGSEISIGQLNIFEDNKINSYFATNWTIPIKTQSLIATIDIIEQMLNGIWTSGNYGVYYTGFPKPINAPEI